MNGVEPGRRHLQSIFGPDKPVIEEAVIAAAWYDAAQIGLEDGASPVEPQAIHLVRGSVTANTVLAQYRQHVTAKIHVTGSLAGQRITEHTDQQDRADHRLLQHRPSRTGRAGSSRARDYHAMAYASTRGSVPALSTPVF